MRGGGPLPVRADGACLKPFAAPPRVSRCAVVTPGRNVIVATVQVTVNDEPRTLPDGATVADLVAALELGPRRIAVEVNRDIVPRADYAAHRLLDGDAVEIIHFVGGG